MNEYTTGIAVPSLTSFAYYAVFLVLLVIWSVHMKLAGLVRVLRTILTFYSALHLLVLHLFQLSSAQSHIQDGPCHVAMADCSQTSSLLARLVLVVCVLQNAMVLYIGTFRTPSALPSMWDWDGAKTLMWTLAPPKIYHPVYPQLSLLN